MEQFERSEMEQFERSEMDYLKKDRQKLKRKIKSLERKNISLTKANDLYKLSEAETIADLKKMKASLEAPDRYLRHVLWFGLTVVVFLLGASLISNLKGG